MPRGTPSACTRFVFPYLILCVSLFFTRSRMNGWVYGLGRVLWGMVGDPRVQRHKAGMERRRQPPLPVDDALLHTLKALPPSKEGDVSAVAGDAPGGTVVEAPPRALKKLSISAAIAGPLLRAWDFLHSLSQVFVT